MLRANVKRQSANRSRRTQRRTKHLSIPEIRWLSEDAPIGTYLVDNVAEELFAAGAKGESVSEFVRTLRHEISFAAKLATMTAENHFINGPRRLRLTERLFRDVKQIQRMIERNTNVGRGDIFLSTVRIYGRPPPPPPDKPDEIDNLLAAMQSARDAIKDFLTTRRPRGNPGNYDPLTRGFIFEVFELWQKILWTAGSPGEGPLFIHLLAAAWRDFDFPTKEQIGQPLEVWLKDRVRKQFPEGICSARLSSQDEALYRAWIGLDLD